MAERSVSYCATIVTESVDDLTSASLIAEFFFHRPHARSFLDGHRCRILSEPASPVHARGLARLETAVRLEKLAPPSESCVGLLALASAAPGPQCPPPRNPLWPGKKSDERRHTGRTLL